MGVERYGRGLALCRKVWMRAGYVKRDEWTRTEYVSDQVDGSTLLRC